VLPYSITSEYSKIEMHEKLKYVKSGSPSRFLALRPFVNPIGIINKD
jgi:hypothetical protein